MKKLYIILIAALTLAACLTACSAKPVSLRGTEAPNLPGPTNDALKVTDGGQDWNITLEQVDKENFAEDDRLLAKGSYQVFQLNQEGSGDTLTAAAAAAAIAEQIAHSLLFLLAFFVVLLAWTLLSHALDLVAKLPGLSGLNKLAGGLLGLVKGLVIVYLAAWVLCGLTGFIPPATIQETHLLRFLTEHSPFDMLMLV